MNVTNLVKELVVDPNQNFGFALQLDAPGTRQVYQPGRGHELAANPDGHLPEVARRRLWKAPLAGKTGHHESENAICHPGGAGGVIHRGGRFGRGPIE